MPSSLEAAAKRFLFSPGFGRAATAAIFAALTIWLGYFAERRDFWPFLGGYSAFFGLYLWAIFGPQKTPGDFKAQIFLGLGLRALLLFSLPNLSDDFYRFLWDGHLIVNGLHPFEHLPVYFSDNQIWPPGLSPELFSLLNSPRYFTVYPPVCQGVFALAASVGGTKIWAGVWVLKVFLLACEAGTIWLLAKCCPPPTPKGETRQPPATFDESGCRVSPLGAGGGAAVCYALNPLAILEITGNCHFEGAMLFFLLAGLLALQRSRTDLAAVFWALSVAVKLLPLLFFPLIIRQLGWKKGLRFVAVFSGASALLFLPMLDLEVLRNMGQSLDFYFQKFEFNASAYYLLREIGYWTHGHNIGHWLGPRLAVLTFLGVLWISERWKTLPMHRDRLGDFQLQNLASAMVVASVLHLVLSPVVHPWYVLTPLLLALVSWERRRAIAWSGAVVLSYSHYAGGGFLENYWLIGLEYSLVAAAILVTQRRKGLSSKTSSPDFPVREHL